MSTSKKQKINIFKFRIFFRINIVLLGEVFVVFCWNDNIELKNQIEIKSFEIYFKMGLLDEWIKEINIKLNSSK